MKIKQVFCIVLAILLLPCKEIKSQAENIQKIILDAGHGGKDPGCLGKQSFEKDITLTVTLLVKEMIQEYIPEVAIILTRDKDTFISLDERVKIANQSKADLFISIHCNAHAFSNRTGSEVYVMGLDAQKTNIMIMKKNLFLSSKTNYRHHHKELDLSSPVSHILLTNYQRNFQERSLTFSHKVEQYLQKIPSLPSRGVKQDIFWVLAKTSMPSVLIEIGFLTNIADEYYLNTQVGKLTIAANIYRAFRDYKNEIEGKYK